jgi:uncharacterized protein (TIGR03083 family)
VEPDRLLAALETESGRVLELQPAALDVDVPWCEGWTVGDVVGHLSTVQRWGTALSNGPGTWVRRRDMEAPPAGARLLEWFADGVAPMLAAFDGTDLDVVVNTWAGEQARRWWLRRLTHETAVHRWDTEAATTPSARPIDVDVAVDGIDELLENFLPLVHDKFGGAGETLHLHVTDGEGEWQVTYESDDVRVERSHAEADCALRGPASELLLVLWNRRPVEAADVEVDGDRTVFDRWRATVRI